MGTARSTRRCATSRNAWRGLRRRPASPPPRSRRWRSASAPTPPSSAWSTRCSSSRCRIATPSGCVFVWADQTAEGYPRAPLSGPELTDLDQRTTLFDGFGAIWATTAALTGENDPEQLRVGLVTTDFFSLLGADAALGPHVPTDDDAARRADDDPAERTRSGSAATAAIPPSSASAIEVNGQPTTVVGVMPADFRLMMPPDAAVPDDLEAWLPFNRRFPEGPRGQRYLRVIGRMRPGVAVDEAQEDIARVGREISAAHAFYGAAGRQFETVPLHVDATRDVRRPLLALFDRCRHPAAHRVRERRQPAGRAGRGAGPRDGGEGGARRRHRTPRAPARRRVAAARRRSAPSLACCSAAGGWPRCWPRRPKRSAGCASPPSTCRSSSSGVTVLAWDGARSRRAAQRDAPRSAWPCAAARRPAGRRRPGGGCAPR